MLIKMKHLTLLLILLATQIHLGKSGGTLPFSSSFQSATIPKPETSTPSLSSLFDSIRRFQSIFPIPKPKTSAPFSSSFQSATIPKSETSTPSLSSLFDSIRRFQSNFPIPKPKTRSTPFSPLFHSLIRPQSTFPMLKPETSTPFSSLFHSLFRPQPTFTIPTNKGFLPRIIPIPFPIYIYKNCDSKDADKTETNEGLSQSENGDVIENDTVPEGPELREVPELPQVLELPEAPVVAGDTDDIETEKEKNQELHHYYYEVGSY